MVLLCCNVVAGPAGSSVREIMRQTGADIKSWTEQSTHRSKRPARVFLVSVSCQGRIGWEGGFEGLLQAMDMLLVCSRGCVSTGHRDWEAWY